MRSSFALRASIGRPSHFELLNVTEDSVRSLTLSLPTAANIRETAALRILARTSGRIRETAHPRGRARFRLGGRAVSCLFFVARPIAVRVGLLQPLGRIGHSRRKQQPECEELRDLLRRKATLRGRRLRRPWLRCERKG